MTHRAQYQGPELAQRILRDTLGYSTSAVVAQGVSLVAGLWVARLLGPANFGVWNAVSLVLVYGAFLADAGVLSAFGRDFPMHRGAGDEETASVVEGAARWAAIVGSVIVAAGVIALSFWWQQSQMMSTGLRVMAMALILQQIYTYHRTVLRANNEFGELSRQQVLLAVVTASLAVGGVQLIGLIGRMCAAVLAQATILLYAVRRNPWLAVPRPAPATLTALMRVGVPIIVSGFVMSLMTTVDRLMVITFLGEEQLGYFGLAIVLTSVVPLVPAMASQVLYPRMTYRFGESGRDVDALRSLVLTPSVVLAYLLPLVIGPLFLVLPLLIQLVVPAFAPGTAATGIVVIGLFFFSIVGVTDYLLVTIRKLRQYMLLGFVGLALKVVFGYAFLSVGYGIEGVAFAGTLLTYFIYSFLVIWYALSHYTRDPREWGRYFSRLWLPFVYMLGLLWLVDLTVSQSMPFLGFTAATIAQVALYLVGASPLVFMAARELKLDVSLASLARLWSSQ